MYTVLKGKNGASIGIALAAISMQMESPTLIRRKQVLLTMVGPSTYKLLSNLSAPAKPSQKSLATLNALLQKHFNPKPSEIVQRFKFNSRRRNKSESIATFVSELRALSEHCNFGDTLDTMIRNRLVCGVNDKAIQEDSCQKRT